MGSYTDRTDSEQDAKDLDQLREGVSKAKKGLSDGRIETVAEPDPEPKKPKSKLKRRTIEK